MKAFLFSSLALGIAAALSGCGDPAPSTKLAPDLPTANSSSAPPADLEKIKAAEHASGGTPPDRTTPGR